MMRQTTQVFLNGSTTGTLEKLLLAAAIHNRSIVTNAPENCTQIEDVFPQSVGFSCWVVLTEDTT